MLLLYKILFYIWILEIKLSQINFKNINSNVKYKNKFVYCFKCSNINKKYNNNILKESIDTYRNKYNKLSVKYHEHSTEFGNVNSQYLSLLNWELNNLNYSIANYGSEQCYKDLERIFDMISEPVSSFYSEPFEIDYNTKLNELNTKFGLNLDKIDPLFILKLSPYRKKTDLDLSFEYLTEQTTNNGEIENKLWKRELKEDVPKDLIKQLCKALNEFSKTIGNFFYKFYKDEIPMDNLLDRAIKLGLQATGELFDGLTILQLKNKSNIENLKKSLDIIVHYSHIDEFRLRCYSKLIDHFFRNNDPESIFEILKHLITFSNKKINSIFLTQYFLSLVNKYEQKLNESDKNKKKLLLLEFKEKLRDGLELYKENNLSTFNITPELAEIFEKKFSNIVPGLFKLSFVSINKEDKGICELCKTNIEFDDITDDERFELLSKMLQTISLTCPNELSGLFNFYEFLKNAKMSGNQYTCIIDGQNIGYSGNNNKYLNWFKMNYSFNFMKSTGENPLIVVPHRGISLLLKNIKTNEPDNYKLINEMIQNGSFYLTNKYSYDDNFFLLAGMATFSDREMELFLHYLRSHNFVIPEKYQFNYIKDVNNNNNITNVSNNDISNNTINTNTNNINNEQKNKTKNVIILTNDRLGNLKIENVRKELLDKWMNYSLINFNCYSSLGKEIFVLGQRLKYTFDIFSNKDKFHIPIGMDRIFTNSMEILKCSFQLKNIDNTTKVFLSLYPIDETPIKKWIKNNSQYLYPPSDYRHTLSNDYIDQSSIKKSNQNKDNKIYHKSSDIFHRSPEIARLMFSPQWKPSWLCIDLNTFNELISKL